MAGLSQTVSRQAKRNAHELRFKRTRIVFSAKEINSQRVSKQSLCRRVPISRFLHFVCIAYEYSFAFSSKGRIEGKCT